MYLPKREKKRQNNEKICLNHVTNKPNHNKLNISPNQSMKYFFASQLSQF